MLAYCLRRWPNIRSTSHVSFCRDIRFSGESKPTGKSSGGGGGLGVATMRISFYTPLLPGKKTSLSSSIFLIVNAFTDPKI